MKAYLFQKIFVQNFFKKKCMIVRKFNSVFPNLFYNSNHVLKTHFIYSSTNTLFYGNCKETGAQKSRA
jgi:hypothetical protein